MRPDARIIAILREPASFLRSLHLQMVAEPRGVPEGPARAIALEDVRRQGRKIPRNAHWPQALMYTDRVRYVEQLRRFHDAFGSEQVLVLIYDDFKADNEGTFRAVLRFLEVDDTVAAQAMHANPSIAIRSPRLHGLVRSVRVGAGPVAGSGEGDRQGPHESADAPRAAPAAQGAGSCSASPVRPTRRWCASSRSRFRGEVLALSEYLDRDLVALWGYDDVG